MGEENMTQIHFDIERKKKYKHTRERADQLFFFFLCILGSRGPTGQGAALCRSDDFSLVTTLSLILKSPSALMR